MIIKYMTSCGRTVEYHTSYTPTQDDISNVAGVFQAQTKRNPTIVALSPDIYKTSYSLLYPAIHVQQDGTILEIIRTSVGPARLICMPKWTNFMVVGEQIDIDKYLIDEIFEEDVLK